MEEKLKREGRGKERKKNKEGGRGFGYDNKEKKRGKLM